MAAALVAKKAHMGPPKDDYDPTGDKLPSDSHCTLFAELKRQVRFKIRCPKRTSTPDKWAERGTLSESVALVAAQSFTDEHVRALAGYHAGGDRLAEAHRQGVQERRVLWQSRLRRAD